MSNASSKAITSSTTSSESAPRSSTNDALGVTSPSSTPNCSETICFTLSSTAIAGPPARRRARRKPLSLTGSRPSVKAAKGGALSFRPIPIAQLRLPVNQRNFHPIDKDVLHVRLHVERIAIGHHHICHLVHIKRTQLIGHAEHLRRIQRHRLQRLVIRQAIGHRIAGSIR